MLICIRTTLMRDIINDLKMPDMVYFILDFKIALVSAIRLHKILFLLVRPRLHERRFLVTETLAMSLSSHTAKITYTT